MKDVETQLYILDTLKPVCESESDTHHVKGYVDDEQIPYITVENKHDPSQATLLIMQHSANETMAAMLRVFSALKSVTSEAS